MRDPQGVLALEGDRAVRRLCKPLDPGHFLYTGTSQALVSGGHLLPWEAVDAVTISSPLLPFVPHPSEWCDGQFHDAACLTLDLAEAALTAGHEIKDASAWNVLFEGARPVFCDHLSFQPADGRLWWAAGQFARHFVVPLWLARARGLPARCSLQVWRDGVPPAVARGLLGPRRFLSRCWPLVADGRTDAPLVTPAAGFGPAERRFRERLHTSLRWMLESVAPRPAAGSVWSGYVQDRPQYPGESFQLKRSTVGNWLTRLTPDRVVDLGCNTGEFSELAQQSGAQVVAIDADQDCIEVLYRRRRGQPGLLPMVATLDDLSAGRGWNGSELPGLPQRLNGCFDLALALALIHHLTIAASIPVEQVAAAAHLWTRRWLVLECPHPTDPQVMFLCRQHRRRPEEFGLDRVLAAFGGHSWRLAECVVLAPAERSLLLLERSA